MSFQPLQPIYISRHKLLIAETPENVLKNLKNDGDFSIPEDENPVNFINRVFQLKKDFEGYSFTEDDLLKSFNKKYDKSKLTIRFLEKILNIVTTTESSEVLDFLYRNEWGIEDCWEICKEINISDANKIKIMPNIIKRERKNRIKKYRTRKNILSKNHWYEIR